MSESNQTNQKKGGRTKNSGSSQLIKNSDLIEYCSKEPDGETLINTRFARNKGLKGKPFVSSTQNINKLIKETSKRVEEVLQNSAQNQESILPSNVQS